MVEFIQMNMNGWWISQNIIFYGLEDIHIKDSAQQQLHLYNPVIYYVLAQREVFVKKYVYIYIKTFFQSKTSTGSTN